MKDNPFYEGQRVVCVNENFPIHKTTSEDKSIIGTHPNKHQYPKAGEVLTIDEILGDFLRFDKYDDNDPNSPDFAVNWWHFTRFAPIDENSIEEILSEAIKINQGA